MAPRTYYRVKPGLCLSFILLFVPGKKYPETGVRKIYSSKSVRIANSPLVFSDTFLPGVSTRRLRFAGHNITLLRFRVR